MRIGKTMWRIGAVVAVMLAATPAGAQLHTTVHGMTAWDARDLRLFRAGVGVRPQGPGLAVVADLSAYRLIFPLEVVDGEETVNAVQPMLGLRREWPFGSVQGSVGYHFTDAPDRDQPVGAFGAPGAGGDGPLAGAQLHYWGTGERIAQLFSRLNLDSGYTWLDLRGLQQLPLLDGRLYVGADLLFQGEFDTDDYQSLEVGGVAAYRWGERLEVALIAGGKADTLDEEPDDPLDGEEQIAYPFLRLEFTASP